MADGPVDQVTVRGGMFDRIVRLGGVFFPERHVQVHSRGAVTTLTLSTSLQAGVAGAALLGAGLWLTDGLWSGAAGDEGGALASVVSNLQNQLAAAQQAAQSAESRLNNFLTDQNQASAQHQPAPGVRGARKAVSDGAGAGAAGAAEPSPLPDQASADSVATVVAVAAVEPGSSVSESSAQDVAAENASQAERLKQLEAELAALTQQNNQAHQLYEQAVSELKSATLEQKKLKSERERLSADKTKMQTRIESLAADKATAEKEREKVEKQIVAERDRINEKIKQKVAELARKQTAQGREGVPSVTILSPRSDAGRVDGGRVDGGGQTRDVASAPPSGGFSLERFLTQMGLGAMKTPAVGGPFVAAPGRLADPAQNAQLQAVLKTLPLTQPVQGGQLESRFGARSDPFNGRQSIHTGLDFSAPYKSPVYNTSPGTVVFAGYAGAYGRLVEVDHGNGIHTKYGHLNRISVNVGQKLTGKVEIGQLGSTGRSTGPHVHYEVLVNGTPQDPERFLEAGRSLLGMKQ